MDTSGAAAKGRNPKRLTDRTVVALRAESGRRVTRPDGDVPGLAIRVNAGGRKTFTLTYRIGRRQRRWTLGTYPVISLAAARKKARLALTQLDRTIRKFDRTVTRLDDSSAGAHPAARGNGRDRPPPAVRGVPAQ